MGAGASLGASSGSSSSSRKDSGDDSAPPVTLNTAALTALKLWTPAPGPEADAYSKVLKEPLGARLREAVAGIEVNESDAARALFANASGWAKTWDDAVQKAREAAPKASPIKVAREAASKAPLDEAARKDAEDAAACVAIRAIALARAGLRVSPVSFLRSSLVRLPEVPRLIFHDQPDVPEAVVAAAVKLGRDRLTKAARRDKLSAGSAVAPEDVADVNLTGEIVRSTDDFRRLADPRLNKVAPEEFIRHFLMGSIAKRVDEQDRIRILDGRWVAAKRSQQDADTPAAVVQWLLDESNTLLAACGRRTDTELWEDLSLIWHLCDLDDDGFLDSIEFAAARWVIGVCAAGGGRASYLYRLRPVLPPALVHGTKRVMAAKRELSVRRVRGVFICAREGDKEAKKMRDSLEAILKDREYSVAHDVRAELLPEAIIVVMTPRCLDACISRSDAMYKQLEATISAPGIVIVPVFSPSYFPGFDYVKVRAERAKLSAKHAKSLEADNFDLEAMMEKVCIRKGATLDEAHIDAVGKLLHNLLQGRELSTGEEN